MSVTAFLARWRVTMGFVCGAVVLGLATPTVVSLALGAVVALVGEAVRLWAAGHLEKSREVTSSGPYRFTRHPLYVGTSIIAVGVVVAANHPVAAILVGLYLGLTISAAVRAEEAHLREKFGGAYDAYAERRGPRVERPWSWARARFNREHHTMAGVAGALALLALKMAVGA
ncbi:MAG: isoprenylcysteine carboxylmethyltransferase family protein [Vicinamibacterales bacterium]